jgi:hypothetical protein
MANKTIISANVARHFDGPDGRTFETHPGYLGDVPDWLPDNEYFKACVNDSSITSVGVQPANNDAPKAAVKAK